MPHVWLLVLIREVKAVPCWMLQKRNSWVDFDMHSRCESFLLSTLSPNIDHLVSPIELLTGGLPSAGRRLSWSPTFAGPCGVANNKISPVLVGADPGWRPSLLGLVMITIWWSSTRSMLPEFSRVSKSAKRSSDVCPVIKVSDIALCFTGLWRSRGGQILKWCRLPTPI